jgi:hypothetical protein
MSQFILPYLFLVRKGFLAKSYYHDLDYLIEAVRDIKVHQLLLPHTYAIKEAAIEYGTLKDAVDILGDDWSSFLDDEERDVIFPNDPVVFERVVMAANYRPQVASGGYVSMEPEEWLNFWKTWKIDADKKNKILENTVQYAEFDGYTYFARVVRYYAIENNIEIEYL